MSYKLSQEENKKRKKSTKAAIKPLFPLLKDEK